MDNTSKFEALEQALDLEPDFHQIPSEITERLNAVTNADGQEYEIARDNLFSIMKVGGQALSDLQSLAMQTQHPRMFEVLTELMKTMMQGQRELLEIKKLDNDINNKSEAASQQPVNNILVCTPAELMQMINKKSQ